MKKTLKIVGYIVLSLVALVLAAILTLPLWIGPVAKSVANGTVPKYTGTEFNLGEFGLNFYSGRLHVGAVKLGNPEGFDPREALTLGALDVDVEVLSAFSDTVVIRELSVRDVFVSYVSHDGRNNMEVIAENAAKAAEGGEEAESVEKPEDEPSEGEKPGKKVVIDRLSISGVTVQWGLVKLPMPPIVLTGIGRDTDGVDFETAFQTISDAVMKSLSNLSGGLSDLGAAVKDLGLEHAGKAVEAASAVLDKAVDAGSAGKEAVKATSGVLKSVGGAAGSAGNVIGEGAGKAVGAAGDVLKGAGGAAGAAGNAISEGAGKAVEATGDVLKGAGSALKGLFDK